MYHKGICLSRISRWRNSQKLATFQGAIQETQTSSGRQLRHLRKKRNVGFAGSLLLGEGWSLWGIFLYGCWSFEPCTILPLILIASVALATGVLTSGRYGMLSPDGCRQRFAREVLGKLALNTTMNHPLPASSVISGSRSNSLCNHLCGEDAQRRYARHFALLQSPRLREKGVPSQDHYSFPWQKVILPLCHHDRKASQLSLPENAIPRYELHRRVSESDCFYQPGTSGAVEQFHMDASGCARLGTARE